MVRICPPASGHWRKSRYINHLADDVRGEPVLDRHFIARLVGHWIDDFNDDSFGVAYRYHPVGKKPINLGPDRFVAIRKVLDLLGAGDDVGTIARLWEQFQETPGSQRYSQYTRNDYEQCSGALLETFGDMRAADIDATHVSRYLRVERATAPVRANREAALLSNLIGLAIDRGEAKHNPCREVRRNEEQPRTEAPDPEDFQAFAAWVASLGGQKAVIGMAAEYAALAGNRKVEFLDLACPQIDEAAGERSASSARSGAARSAAR
ncbi:hypothetical protein [Burkholderia ambifaria]|uniref:hypothetical protein n=1 Tax=Burkholderia ambifaria TaxID=152480 RepID=UPI002FE22C0D